MRSFTENIPDICQADGIMNRTAGGKVVMAERNGVKDVEHGLRAAHRAAEAWMTGYTGKAATGSACYSG